MYIIIKKNLDTVSSYNVVCDPESMEIMQFETLDEAEEYSDRYGFSFQEGVSIEDSSILGE